jgi:hypothetical protein
MGAQLRLPAQALSQELGFPLAHLPKNWAGSRGWQAVSLETFCQIEDSVIAGVSLQSAGRPHFCPQDLLTYSPRGATLPHRSLGDLCHSGYGNRVVARRHTCPHNLVTLQSKVGGPAFNTTWEAWVILVVVRRARQLSHLGISLELKSESMATLQGSFKLGSSSETLNLIAKGTGLGHGGVGSST